MERSETVVENTISELGVVDYLKAGREDPVPVQRATKLVRAATITPLLALLTVVTIRSTTEISSGTSLRVLKGRGSRRGAS